MAKHLHSHRRWRWLALPGIALSTTHALAGPYSPLPTQAGSTAISATSASIVEWASGASVVRGLRDVASPTYYSANASSPSNYAFYGGSDGASVAAGQTSTANAAPIGEPPQPQQNTYAVALGQNGLVTLTFTNPITNGPGADFAVFNNGFSTGSQEWVKPGVVQVSSDGVHFYSFPSVSLTQTAAQVSSYGELDPTNLYDIAGNFPAGYGTPFDLSELAGVSPLLSVNDVTQVRILSVTGDIDPTYATRDSQGNIINSPWPAMSTAGSEGFNLAGVGVLNQLTSLPSTIVNNGTLEVSSGNPLPTGTALTICINSHVVIDSGTGLIQLNSLNLDPTSTGSALGRLDLSDNALIVHHGNLAQTTAAIQAGSDNLAWDGSAGITSSTAAADTSHLTAVGVLLNATASGNAIYNTSFDGSSNLTLSTSDVLVRYTYYGDANLDGKVDGSDYSLIDNGFLHHATSWQNGDFNYDGVVDGSDYTLIDNAFNQQGATPEAAMITSQIAVPEPGCLCLASIALASLSIRRKR